MEETPPFPIPSAAHSPEALLRAPLARSEDQRGARARAGRREAAKARPSNPAIREGDWKLIHWFGDYLDTTGFTPDDKPYGKLVVGPRTEIYNLREDPDETHNLTPERPKKTTQLTKALQAWLKRTGAKLPTPNPDFDERRWCTSARQE